MTDLLDQVPAASDPAASDRAGWDAGPEDATGSVRGSAYDCCRRVHR